MATKNTEVRRADDALRGQLTLAVEHLLPAKVEAWKAALEANRLTSEMVDVFTDLGWLSSRQDPRLDAATAPAPTAAKVLPSPTLPVKG